MELAKFDRQLQLMALLAQPAGIGVTQLAERTRLTRRTIYRYLDAFKEAGFVVEKHGTKYRLSHRSPFFKQITEHIHFTDDEALTLNGILNSVYDNSPQVRHLREKLSRLYDEKVLAAHGIDQRIARNLSQLYRAVSEERICVLHGYSSPHSHRTADRIVEPYLFLSANSEVRCYEPGSDMNKTFKIGRAESVELLDLQWAHKERHEAFRTDLFHFSGNRQLRVRLLLGRLAASLLREEYPGSERQLTTRDDGRELLDTQVCSYKGIGRFVLGLLDDIEIADSPDFADYLRGRLAQFRDRLDEQAAPAS